MIPKEILYEWENAFPTLTKFNQKKIYKIVGPVILGIELVHVPHQYVYRPHFVCYVLWKPNLRECLLGPFLLQEAKDRRGLHLDLHFVNKPDPFHEAVECTKAQFPFLEKQDVTLEDLLTYIDQYSKRKPLALAPHSFFQAHLLKNALMLALYVNDTKKIESIFTTIENTQWDLKDFALCKIEVNEWKKGIKELIANRELFLHILDKNKQDKALKKLKSFELTA